MIHIRFWFRKDLLRENNLRSIVCITYYNDTSISVADGKARKVSLDRVAAPYYNYFGYQTQALGPTVSWSKWLMGRHGYISPRIAHFTRLLHTSHSKRFRLSTSFPYLLRSQYVTCPNTFWWLTTLIFGIWLSTIWFSVSFHWNILSIRIIYLSSYVKLCSV